MTFGKSLGLALIVSTSLTTAGLAHSVHKPHAKHQHATQKYAEPDMAGGRSAAQPHIYRAGEGSATNNNLNIGNSGPN